MAFTSAEVSHLNCNAKDMIIVLDKVGIFLKKKGKKRRRKTKKNKSGRLTRAFSIRRAGGEDKWATSPESLTQPKVRNRSPLFFVSWWSSE
jgi:hypothetical protein